MTLFELLLLYLAFRAKHVLCDFFLQSGWMAMTKGKPLDEGGGRALFSHTAIHAVGTFIIICFVSLGFAWMAIADFVIHSAIDRAKARLIDKMDWSYTDNKFWWFFGLDQEAHNLTHLAFIVIIVMQLGITGY